VEFRLAQAATREAALSLPVKQLLQAAVLARARGEINGRHEKTPSPETTLQPARVDARPDQAPTSSSEHCIIASFSNSPHVDLGYCSALGHR
jgi:hypothetical protein